MAFDLSATKHLNSEASSVSCVLVEKLTRVPSEHFTINSLDLQRKEEAQDTDYNTRKKTQTRIKILDLTDFFKGYKED